MRWLVPLLATACGRVGFDAQLDAQLGSGTTDAGACPSGVTYCDNFERTVPLRPNDPVWAADSCGNPGESLTVDDALTVSYPTYPGSYVQCQLVSRVTAPARTLDLEFDITFAGHAGDDNVTLAVAGGELAAPNAAGVEWVQLQLDVAGGGAAALAVVYYYPDASQSPDGTNYPAYDAVDSDGLVWLPPGEACHVAITGDTSTPSANAVATCGGAANAMKPHGPNGPAGLLLAPTKILLGYGNSGATSHGGVATYGHMTFTAGP
jgi:hypothetical protein